MWLRQGEQDCCKDVACTPSGQGAVEALSRAVACTDQKGSLRDRGESSTEGRGGRPGEGLLAQTAR